MSNLEFIVSRINESSKSLSTLYFKPPGIFSNALMKNDRTENLLTDLIENNDQKSNKKPFLVYNERKNELERRDGSVIKENEEAINRILVRNLSSKANGNGNGSGGDSNNNNNVNNMNNINNINSMNANNDEFEYGESLIKFPGKGNIQNLIKTEINPNKELFNSLKKKEKILYDYKSHDDEVPEDERLINEYKTINEMVDIIVTLNEQKFPIHGLEEHLGEIKERNLFLFNEIKELNLLKEDIEKQIKMANQAIQNRDLETENHNSAAAVVVVPPSPSPPAPTSLLTIVEMIQHHEHEIHELKLRIAEKRASL
ncbi:uncharacterized protein ASCRUDRAFT_78598 [Ascoidea rubescens DSM 1968]|uniref:DASH complex subunit SPC34 n=1 Tax=Ascoidea rubescens DSM 1968 TaxID=1344418 RepID=A0A1D2VPH0_9ASCO|nr:hypothetical protein ASCRUDRAFT_78598 [Ascoidea rubescens DSM 1968]ODV63511.1 hypothetical protein ASCRUDRAFT_78598 [Ascoidea rubescens DSM 1968]